MSVLLCLGSNTLVPARLEIYSPSYSICYCRRLPSPWLPSSNVQKAWICIHSFATRSDYVIWHFICYMSQHIHVEMDMTTSWKDKRLQYKAEPPNTTIVLQNSGGASIWRPDLIVISEKGVKYKTFPETLAACRISPSGDVLFSQRYIETLLTLRFLYRYGNSLPML